MAVLRIGLISDTHGLLRPEAVAFLNGSNHIIHAGDIGSPAILDELAALAPLTAVRGNNDHGPWAEALPEIATVPVGSTSILVIHDLKDLTIDPAAAGHRVVVAGHSHRPYVEERNGVLYVNPGSAGPRRFRLPVAVAELFVDGGFVSARWVELEIGKSG
ncbi:MAG: metallophosphoesterase family protein [Actinomycetota bacterium]